MHVIGIHYHVITCVSTHTHTHVHTCTRAHLQGHLQQIFDVSRLPPPSPSVPPAAGGALPSGTPVAVEAAYTLQARYRIPSKQNMI